MCEAARKYSRDWIAKRKAQARLTTPVS
jgi:hypothetical protein